MTPHVMAPGALRAVPPEQPKVLRISLGLASSNESPNLPGLEGRLALSEPSDRVDGVVAELAVLQS